MSSLYLVSFCFLFVELAAYGPFPIQYIGNYLTINQYDNLTLCQSKICLLDSEKLIASASYISNLNPCESFRNFTCGTFYEDRALNERYESIGFQRDLEVRNDEKRHKALKGATRTDDGKAVRIVKNLYQKCIDWSECSCSINILLELKNFISISRVH